MTFGFIHTAECTETLLIPHLLIASKHRNGAVPLFQLPEVQKIPSLVSEGGAQQLANGASSPSKEPAYRNSEAKPTGGGMQ